MTWETMPLDPVWAPILRCKVPTKQEADEVAAWMKRLTNLLAEKFTVIERREPTISHERDLEYAEDWFYVSCRFIAKTGNPGYYKPNRAYDDSSVGGFGLTIKKED